MLIVGNYSLSFPSLLDSPYNLDSSSVMTLQSSLISVLNSVSRIGNFSALALAMIDNSLKKAISCRVLVMHGYRCNSLPRAFLTDITRYLVRSC